jgi:hypothetical protein
MTLSEPLAIVMLYMIRPRSFYTYRPTLIWLSGTPRNLSKISEFVFQILANFGRTG